MITSLAFVSCANQPTGRLKLTPDNIEEIIDSMTLDEKIHIVSGSATWGNIDAERVEAERKAVPTSAGIIISIPRLGIPSVVLADGPAGLRIASPCTGFPIGSMLASTWDREVVDKVGTAIGNEVLEYGVDVILGPGANLHRNPLCGRNFEYYSEDPYLAGKIAASYINGVQSNGVGTSIKHYAVNSQEYNRLNNDAIVSQKALRELYLKQFEIAVKEAQPWTVMTSYNYINGVYAPENYDLITGALRGDFGFQGMVMTDWGAGKGGYDKMLKAGNDLIEPAAYTDTLSQAIQNGTVTMEELDAAVRNILKLVVKTPSFKGYERSYKPDLEAHAKISREAATNGMVLLENRGEALPLKKGSTVALFGSGSYSIVCGGTGSGDVNKPYTVSIDEGMKSAGFVLEPNSENAYREHIAIEKERIDPINANADWFVIPLRPGEMQSKNLESIISASVDNADAAIITIARNAGEGQDRWIDGEFNLQDCEMEMITKVCEAFHNAGK